LLQAGIGTEVYYPVALPDQPCFVETGRGGESVVASRKLAAEVVSLPCFPELSEGERTAVIEAVRDALTV
jgi:dTDP-4-amino-4,6-dideoxygalactose transaminase